MFKPGDRVKYHPVCGGRSAGLIFTIRHVEFNHAWLYGVDGIVRLTELAPVKPAAAPEGGE